MKKSTWVILVVFFICLAVGGAVILMQQGPPITKTAQVTLEITLSPDFTLAASPDYLRAPINRTASFNASVTSVNDFTGEVVFSVTGEPVGATISFFPGDTLTLGVGETRGVQIDVMIPDDANIVGTHMLTVTATSTNYN